MKPPKKIQILPFAKPYDKLWNRFFPTLRGKSWFNRVKEGEMVHVEVEGVKGQLASNFHAKVLWKLLKPIKEIPISFLEYDTMLYGQGVRSYTEFVDLINAMKTRKRWGHFVTIYSEMTVLLLAKIEDDSN